MHLIVSVLIGSYLKSYSLFTKMQNQIQAMNMIKCEN